MLFVISFFRHSSVDFVRRYMARVKELQGISPCPVSLVCVWGDSPESLGVLLGEEARRHGLDAVIHRYDHGGPVYGSTEQPERMKALSGLANSGLDCLQAYVDANDHVFYVESDLLWEPETVLELSNKMTMAGLDALAPMIYAGPNFYDIWGFRGLDGERFGPFKPYHPDLKEHPIVEVSSVGSAFVMRGALVEDVRIKDDYALVGFWRDARAKGYRVFVDQMETVRHP
jgi:hypothetical protein